MLRLGKILCLVLSLHHPALRIDPAPFFALAVKISAESLKGVSRTTVVARWGVGYDTIDVPALTANDVVLTITPNGVKRPVSEAIFAFILGLVPLVLASGAGANAQKSIGFATLTGMIGSTLLTVAVVPSLFVVVRQIEARLTSPKARSRRSGG